MRRKDISDNTRTDALEPDTSQTRRVQPVHTTSYRTVQPALHKWQINLIQDDDGLREASGGGAGSVAILKPLQPASFTTILGVGTPCDARESQSCCSPIAAPRCLSQPIFGRLRRSRCTRVARNVITPREALNGGSADTTPPHTALMHSDEISKLHMEM